MANYVHHTFKYTAWDGTNISLLKTAGCRLIEVLYDSTRVAYPGGWTKRKEVSNLKETARNALRKSETIQAHINEDERLQGCHSAFP